MEDDATVDREAELAAQEAGRIGGDAPDYGEDPAHQPLAESGEGESEGFELAERQLIDIASHGDQHRFPDRDVRDVEDATGGDDGEADEESSPDA